MIKNSRDPCGPTAVHEQLKLLCGRSSFQGDKQLLPISTKYRSPLPMQNSSTYDYSISFEFGNENIMGDISNAKHINSIFRLSRADVVENSPISCCALNLINMMYLMRPENEEIALKHACITHLIQLHCQ